MFLSFTRDIDTQNGVKIVELTADRLEKKNEKEKTSKKNIQQL